MREEREECVSVSVVCACLKRERRNGDRGCTLRVEEKARFMDLCMH